jgi:hypothetical protein
MEIGQIKPGAIVELPPELLKEGETSRLAMLGSVDVYASGNVQPYLRTQTNEGLAIVAAKICKPETIWPVVEAAAGVKLLKDIKERIQTGNLSVPGREIVSGSDPEFFVFGTDGKVIPSWKFLKDKKSALVDALPYVDGFQAEIGPTAKQCLQQHVDAIREQVLELAKYARRFDKGAKISVQNTVEIADDVMKAATDEEVRFLCTPSLNVYRDPGNPTPEPREYKYRFAGGHLHAGFGNIRFTPPVIREVIKALDGILGLAGVSLASHVDNPERRKMYGRAGEFRLPQHGIEYRVLSNFWLGHPALSHLVLELFRGAIKFALAGLYSTCWEGPEDDELREIINSCDVTKARKILSKNIPCLTAILKAKLYVNKEYANHMYMPATALPLAIKTICEGTEVAISDPVDVHKNWHLDDGIGWASLCLTRGASWATVK